MTRWRGCWKTVTSRALLDTDILLDLIIEGRAEHGAALGIFDLVDAGELQCCVVATSLKDVYYITRKHLPEATVRAWLDFFMDTCEVLPVDEAICRAARASDEPDFEDGIIRACAEASFIDVILTRDADAFLTSKVAKAVPSEYLAGRAENGM